MTSLNTKAFDSSGFKTTPKYSTGLKFVSRTRDPFHNQLY